MPVGRRMQETEEQRRVAFDRLADERLDASYLYLLASDSRLSL